MRSQFPSCDNNLNGNATFLHPRGSFHQGRRWQMFKKSLFAVFGLALALAFATPEKAHAGVAIGVTVGGPVVVARPAYPYPYVYPRPVVYPPAYVYGRPY